MEVETYEAIEMTYDGTVECEAEALELIESLNLEGQKSLVKKDVSGTVARSPYRKMTQEELIVYQAILPRRVKLPNYSDGPIPLRVLQVAAHASELFKSLEVWCPQNVKDPDPLLVGLKGEHYWQPDFHILARWGEVLEPFNALADKASVMVRNARKNGLHEIIAKCQAALVVCDMIPATEVLAGNCKIPSVDGV